MTTLDEFMLKEWKKDKARLAAYFAQSGMDLPYCPDNPLPTQADFQGIDIAALQANADNFPPLTQTELVRMCAEVLIDLREIVPSIDLPGIVLAEPEDYRTIVVGYARNLARIVTPAYTVQSLPVMLLDEPKQRLVVPAGFLFHYTKTTQERDGEEQVEHEVSVLNWQRQCLRTELTTYLALAHISRTRGEWGDGFYQRLRALRGPEGSEGEEYANLLALKEIMAYCLLEQVAGPKQGLFVVNEKRRVVWEPQDLTPYWGLKRTMRKWPVDQVVRLDYVTVDDDKVYVGTNTKLPGHQERFAPFASDREEKVAK